MKYIVSLRGKNYEVEVEHGDAKLVRVSDAQPVPSPSPAPAAAAAPTPTTSAPAAGEPVPVPMPGVIVSIKCTARQTVQKGDLLVVMEAMKMENEIFAPFAGTILQVAVSEGASVNTGDPLLFLQRKDG